MYKRQGKDVTKESINAAMKAATSESFGYNEDQIVSSDVIGMRYGSLFDATPVSYTHLWTSPVLWSSMRKTSASPVNAAVSGEPVSVPGRLPPGAGSAEAVSYTHLRYHRHHPGPWHPSQHPEVRCLI